MPWLHCKPCGSIAPRGFAAWVRGPRFASGDCRHAVRENRAAWGDGWGLANGEVGPRHGRVIMRASRRGGCAADEQLQEMREEAIKRVEMVKKTSIAEGNGALEEALFDSIFANDSQRLIRAVAAGARLDAKINRSVGNLRACPALACAALSGSGACVDDLLRLGANIDEPDGLGKTPLICAVLRGHVSMALGLIGAGANLSARDVDGDDAVICAARLGELSVLAALRDAGADMDAKCGRGMRALSACCAEGHSGAVKFLIDAGADVNADDDYEWTAAHEAAVAGFSGSLEALDQAGVDWERENDDHFTPAMVARIHGREEAACFIEAMREKRVLMNQSAAAGGGGICRVRL
jgi:hypothetical protein